MQRRWRGSGWGASVTISFVKYEGLGNDFLVVEGASASAEQARRWCDRRRGVGADGVLVVAPAEGADARMIVLNADGSRPQMCGNGLRCVAAHVMERQGRREGALVILTDAGPMRCEVQGGQGAWSVFVQGRAASFDPEEVGVARGARPVEGAPLVVEVGGERVGLWLCSVGNPHAVLFVEDAAADLREVALRLGPAVGALGVFTQGVNVGCARVEAGGLRVALAVYERGAGLTLACGTGAAAAAAVAVARALAPALTPLAVALPGGDLEIVIGAPDGAGRRENTTRGPARRVFEGTLAPWLATTEEL